MESPLPAYRTHCTYTWRFGHATTVLDREVDTDCQIPIGPTIRPLALLPTRVVAHARAQITKSSCFVVVQPEAADRATD
jgi:hypothetical protein